MSGKPGKSLLEKIQWAFGNVPAVGALALLLVVNGILLVAQPLKKVDPYSLPATRTWAWWATQDFVQKQAPPDVVLLGSSLMMIPAWHQEAAFRNKDVDLVADHRCTYLETVIKKFAPVGDISAFNFALPGSMVSDTCMVVRSMLKDERKPRIIIIGYGPREFVDNRFNCAASSKHYQYLARFTDTHDLVDLSMPQLWQRPNYWIKDSIYFKGHSNDVQILTDQMARKVFAPLLTVLPSSPLEKVSDEDRRFASYKDELEKGVWVAHPTSPYWYVNAEADCKKRFKTPNDPLYNNQKQWLDLLLATCKERDILPVVVNMPITDIAKAAMPPGVYQRHVETLKLAAAKYDVPYVDIDIPNHYEREDFTDWAHMDASGGKKVLDLIGEYIGRNQKVVAKLCDQSSIASKRQKNM